MRRNINSGGAGAVPRNTGLRMSRGEYIFFMDSDDAITNTAFEELYTLAKKFDADVLHCEKYYKAPADTVTTNKNLLKLDFKPKAKLLDAPEIIPFNLDERVKEFIQREILWTPWSYLIRRDLIAKNNLQFPNVFATVDYFFGFYLLFYAEKLVRLPNVFYVWRRREDSPTHSLLPNAEAWVHKRCRNIFLGIKILDDFMNQFDVFKKYPEYKYGVFNLLIDINFGQVLQIYSQIPAFTLDDLIRRELEQIKDNEALTAFIFARMNIFNVNIVQQQNLIRQQQAQIQQLQTQIRKRW